MKRSFGGIVLLLQALLGPATALAHAAERTSVPAAIEAQHSSTCVVVHDAARCPGCAWSLQSPPVSPVDLTRAATGSAALPACTSDAPARPLAALTTAPPRAPPVILL